MDIIYSDHYTDDDCINELYNYYNNEYNLYKKQKNICMYLLKYNNKITGIISIELFNKLCKIFIFEINMYLEDYAKEFIYFIGDLLSNKFEKIIFNYINNILLKKLYEYVLKYNKYFIYDIENKKINNFLNIINNYDNNFYYFSKYELNKRNNFCWCIF